MEALPDILEEIFWKYLKIGLEKAEELVRTSLVKLTALTGEALDWAVRTGQKLWDGLTWPEMVLAGALVVVALAFWMFRERLYRDYLIYNIHWLRFKGYAKRRIHVRRGGVSRTVDVMAVPTPLPERFSMLRIYRAVPDRYVVAFGTGADGQAEDLREYSVLGGSGYAAMRRDIAGYLLRNLRFVNPRSEIDVLLAHLAELDQGFSGEAVRR